MANILLPVLYTFILVIHEVRTESVIEVLFSTLSDRIDSLDRAFEVKLDNSVAEINNRLDKIETVIGIKEHDSDDPDAVILGGIMEKQTLLMDIRIAKRTFMKAMVTEKTKLRKFASEYEKKFKEFKHEVKDVLNGMNGSIIDSKDSRIDVIEQNYQTCNEQIRDALSEIHSVKSNTKTDRDNLKSEILILEGRVSTTDINQRQQDSKIETLDSLVSSLNSTADIAISSLSSKISSLDLAMSALHGIADIAISLLSSRISSLDSRVSALHERKVGFTFVLSSTKSYSKGRVIVFDNEVYNYDDNYDTSSGKFTAPKSGTYLFSVSVEGTYSKAANVVFKTSYNLISGIRMSAMAYTDVHVTGSSTCVIYMREGGQAWVESFIDGGYLRSRTSFSGVLIG